MLKRTTLLPLLLLALLAACGKKEPPAPPPPLPQSTAPAPAPSAAATPAPAPAETPAPAPAAPAAPAAGGETVAKGGDVGKKTYDTTCMACHAAGVAGAPKFGDKAAWGPRIAQGIDTLHTHALKGFQGKAGMMPPKGGNMSLPDADVKAAVDYMVEHGK